MTRTLKIYVAGPMSSPDPFQFLRNLDAGVAMTAQLLDEKFAPLMIFCDFQAVMRTRKLSMQGIKNVSLAWLPHADAMLLLPGWHNSAGTIAEVEEAREHDIPIFDSIGALIGYREQLERQELQEAKSDD